MSLIERENELARLTELLSESMQGRGRVAMITGPTATGKTELMHAFSERAVNSGVTWLSATCSRAEQNLSLGTVSQIFHSAALPPDYAAKLARLLEDAASHAKHSESQPEGLEWLRVTQGLWAVILELSRANPLIITVDDVNYADSLSWRLLAHFVNRLRTANVLIMMTATKWPERAELPVDADLMHHPHCHRLKVASLSPDGATRLLASTLGKDVAESLGPDCYRISGGNPLLVGALLEDSRGMRDGIVVGDTFSRSVRALLHRCDPVMSHVARGLAVLGHDASAALLPEFLELQPAVVEQALSRLGDIGVLDSMTFRHPVARSAVLEELDPGEREEAHGRAAALLHAQGVASTVVARHLLGAPGLRAAFAPSVLHEAAGQALADDQHESAIQCLKLAAELDVDGPGRTLATTRLAKAEWQLNPAAVARHIGPLTEAALNGEAGPREMYALFRFQLWDGRLDEAAEVFEHLIKRVDESGQEEFAVQVDAAHHWLSHSYPSVLLHTGRNVAPPPRVKRATHGLSLQAQAAMAMSAVLREDPGIDAVKTAERVLQSVTLDDSHLEALESALFALIYSDRTDRAVLWCDVLYHEATERRSPTWRALLAAFRACIAIRQGDLMTAEEYADIALTVLPPRSLGVMVGLPLSAMLRATTEMGKYEAATRYLRIPVPDTLFQTRFGLHYLDARARYYLAMDHPLAALKDFVTCGRLAREWDLDVPMLTPWRQGAAAALLQMGEPGQAQQYVEQHTSLPSGHSLRTKGVSLRLRAAVSDLRQRPSLLRESVEVLQTAGDRLEMAYTLVDLVRTLEELGESSRAQMIEHRAATVARSCGAEPLRSRLPGAFVGEAAVARGEEPADAGFISVLSDAEQRVASLAALGYTNREIARKIFITVSTVEQHLTRIYRKLNVTGRKDLPSQLTQKAMS